MVVEKTKLLAGSRQRVEREANGVPWCVPACVHVRVCKRLCLCTLCVHACVCTGACSCACSVCMHVCTYMYAGTCSCASCVCMHVCAQVCVHVRVVCACMSVYSRRCLPRPGFWHLTVSSRTGALASVIMGSSLNTHRHVLPRF